MLSLSTNLLGHKHVHLPLSMAQQAWDKANQELDRPHSVCSYFVFIISLIHS